MNPEQVHPGVLATTERMRQYIVDRRIAGAKFDDIAAELGMTRQTISRHYYAALQELKRETVEMTGELRTEIHARLEYLWNRLQPGIDVGKPFAVEKGIAVLDRIAKLYGVDEPTRSETVNITVSMTNAERIAAIEKLQAAALERRQRAAGQLPPGEPPALEVVDLEVNQE